MNAAINETFILTELLFLFICLSIFFVIVVLEFPKVSYPKMTKNDQCKLFSAFQRQLNNNKKTNSNLESEREREREREREIFTSLSKNESNNISLEKERVFQT